MLPSFLALKTSLPPSAPHVTCVNYYWEGRRIDERAFARSIAGRCNVELLESRFGTSESLETIRNVQRTAAPILDVIDWQEHSRERDLARSRGATAIFMGSLGDALFQHDIPLSPAWDYLQAHGPTLEFLEVAMDLALHQGVSIWKVFRSVLQSACARAKSGPWNFQDEMMRVGEFNPSNVLVPDEAIGALRSNSAKNIHPWLRDIEGVPAGKLWQIAALYTEGFYHTHFKDEADPPIIAPFLSQPLVELCLRIPSYRNIRKGKDRAMVRDAFDAELPDPILRRTAKGSPDAWLKAMIERDRKFVREFLLDGVLVRERVVDARKLDQALPGRIGNVALHPGNIMNLLYTESWLRAWESAPEAIAHRRLE